MITKKVLQPTNDAFIQFTEEELQEIGAGPGTKFSVKHHDDGSIELRPYVKVELDIEEWPREVLEMIIKESCEQDISANDVINKLLKESLKNFEEESDEDFFSDVTKCCYKEVDDLKDLYGSSSYDAVLPTASNSEYTTASSDMLSTTSYNESVLLNEVGSIDPNFTNNDIGLSGGSTYPDYAV
jgi:hypothetical protein